MKFIVFWIFYSCIVNEVCTSLSGDNVVTKRISKLIIKTRTRIVSEKQCLIGICKTVYKTKVVDMPILIYQQIKVCRDGFIEENDRCIPDFTYETTTVTEPEVTTLPNKPGFTEEVAESLDDPETSNSIVFIITGVIAAVSLAVVVIVSVMCLRKKKRNSLGSKRLLVSNLSTGSAATPEKYNDPETVKSLHVNPGKSYSQNTFTKNHKNNITQLTKSNNTHDYQNTGYMKSKSEQVKKPQNSKEPMKLSAKQLAKMNDQHSYQNAGFIKQNSNKVQKLQPGKINEKHITRPNKSNNGFSHSNNKKQVHQLDDPVSDGYQDLIRDTEVSDHYYDSVR